MGEAPSPDSGQSFPAVRGELRCQGLLESSCLPVFTENLYFLWITLYVFSDWVGDRFICTNIWGGLLTRVTHQPLACGEGEVQAPFFAQIHERAANYLKAKGLGSIQDHVPCVLYKKATSVRRNFSQLKIRKNVYGYWMVCVFFECQSTKIVLQDQEQGESFLAVSCFLYGQQTLFSKPPRPRAQPRTTM